MKWLAFLYIIAIGLLLGACGGMEKQTILKAAQNHIRKDFDRNVEFISSGKIEETDFPGRYDVSQAFIRKDKYKMDTLCYRIRIQVIESKWEYESLAIYNLASKNLLVEMKGLLQPIEKHEGPSYRIIKESRGYILIYTLVRLEDKDLKEIYDKYRYCYNTVVFTLSNSTHPKARKQDYLRISDGVVHDYEKKTDVNLADW